MQFANPIFLWALTGLSIPIGIHLLSRQEGKVIRLGSLRHVQETSTQQFRGIRLNEILLLVLRCLLIVLFTFIISGLHWNNFSKQKWLLIEKGLEKEPRLLPILDSLMEEGYEARLLIEDFPLLEDRDSISSPVNYWSLIEELTSKNLSDVIVFAQNRADNFNGLRSKLPANVRWISQPLLPFDYTLQVLQIKGDSISVREGHTSSEATHYTTKAVSRSAGITKIESLNTLSITLVRDEKYAYDLKIMEAALNAINKSLPVELKVTESSSFDNSSDWCIWFSDNDLPKVHSSKILQIKSANNSHELITPLNASHWIISKRLNEEVALQENLTLKLASLLLPKAELEKKAEANDRRMISDSLAWAATQGDSKALASTLPDSANPYLILLFLVLLFVERSVAYKRNQ